MDDANDEQRLAEVKSRITEISPRDAVELHRRREDVVYLDVREPMEWNLFRIPGAVHVPLGSLKDRVEDVVARDRQVLVYCARGNRAALAADALQQMGYTNVLSLANGVRGWQDAGGELEL